MIQIKRLQDVLPAFLLGVLSLFYFKPQVSFKPNGKPREYGFGLDQEGYKKTLFTVQFLIVVYCFILFRMIK